jgi:hypothetical protein
MHISEVPQANDSETVLNIPRWIMGTYGNAGLPNRFWWVIKEEQRGKDFALRG